MISIITTCYNYEQFLPSYFESLSRQGDIEIIFVDDCSSDGSYEYANSVNFPRIKVIRNPTRLFCSSSYNVALQHVTGDIVAVVDADDALVPGAVNSILSLYDKFPSIGYIYTQHHWCNKHLKPKRPGVSALPSPGVSFANTKKHCFSHWRTFRRELSRKAILFPEGIRYAVDKNLGFILEEVAPGAFYPKSLYYYRYHKANMSLTLAGEQKKTWMKLVREHLNNRKRNHIKVYRVTKIK